MADKVDVDCDAFLGDDDESTSEAEVPVTQPNVSPSSAKKKKKTKRAKKRVSFAPTLITGKSDIHSIPKHKVAHREPQSKPQSSTTTTLPSTETQPFGNDTKQSIDFTNWWDGGNTMSGSETSDNEMDFGNLVDKYRHWSPQFAKFQEREKAKKKVLTELHQEKSKLKKEIQKTEAEAEAEAEEEAKTTSTEAESSSSSSAPKQSQKKKSKKAKNVINRNKIDALTYQKWKDAKEQRGVIYVGGLPFGSTSHSLRKIFEEFGKITNVHLEAAKDSGGKVKKILGKWTEFAEAWVEFEDKTMAKTVSRILNGTKIPKKYSRNRSGRNHVWNMKYLKGFRWHHLLEHKEQLRVLQRKKFERALGEAQRQASFFKDQVHRASKLRQTMTATADSEARRSKKRGLAEMKQILSVGKELDSEMHKNVGEDDDDYYYGNSSDEELQSMAKRPKIEGIAQKGMQHRRAGTNRRLASISKGLFKT